MVCAFPTPEPILLGMLTLGFGGLTETGNISENVAAAIDAFTTEGHSKALDEEDDDEFLDIEDDADELEKLFGGVNSGIAIEKEVAADAIGDIFAATGQSFLPYVERSVTVLVKLLDHYYEGIRKSALSSLFKFINSFYDLSEPASWTAGINVVGSFLKRFSIWLD